MLLQVTNLSYTLEHKQVLQNLNLKIKTTQISAVLGINGSGKTTLLKLIAGLLEPTSGEISFEGKKVLGPNDKLIPGHSGIALVKQDNRLLPFHTVRQNLAHILPGVDDKAQQKKIKQLSGLLGLTEFLDRQLKFLSGGEQQRVSIAAALASNPRLLLMDEPFSQTDMYLKQELKVYLQEIVNKLGISILFVTHQPEDALALGDEIFILNKGKIIEKGNSRDLYYFPQKLVTAALTGITNYLPVDLFLEETSLHTMGKRILVRPDQIKINSSESKSFQARIEKVEFCGLFQQLHLYLTDRKISLISAIISSDSYRKGDEVWISFSSPGKIEG